MAKKIFEIGTITSELTAQGVLTLEGEGTIPDFTDAFAPWFKDRKKITKVIIGPYIDYVGENTFEGALNLEDIIIMNKETMVNKNAFNGCNSVENVLAKKEVRDIFFTEDDYTYYSFNSEHRLVRIAHKNNTIVFLDEYPKIDGLKISELNDDTYYDLTHNKKFIMIESDNIIRVNGHQAEFIVFGDIEKIDVPYAYSYELKRIFIPNTVRYLATSGFTWSRKLKTIEFAKDSIIECLPQACFVGAPAKKIVIPSSVTNIENSCFCYSKLEEVTFSSPVKLGDYAFHCSKDLKTINGSDNIIELGKSTFQGCSDLSELNGGFSKKLLVIPKSCFKQARSAEIIQCVEESNIERIEDGAFVETTSKSFVAPITLMELGKKAFMLSRIEELDLRYSSIRTIQSSTFESSAMLRSVKLPETATKINARAFHDCRNIHFIDLNNNIKSIGPYSFTNLYCTFKVPKSLKNWGSFAVLNQNSLYDIDFSENENFVVENGIIYDKKKSKVLGTTPDFAEDDKNIVIPSSVKSFKGLYDYEKYRVTVTFPSSIGHFPTEEIKLHNCDIKINNLNEGERLRWLSCKSLYVPKEYKDRDPGVFPKLVNFF